MKKRKISKTHSLLIPCLIVFLSSACIMIIELLAGRLIAKHLGSSLYTWTSIIGAVLAGITIGNYLGGKLADRYQGEIQRLLSIQFTFCSFSCISIIFMSNLINHWIWLWYLPWPVRIFTHISILFLLPATLLGMISPVIAKMAIDKGQALGNTIGLIYAWSAAGSIAGTFLAGFVLIPFIATSSIIWFITLFLILTGYFFHKTMSSLISMLIILILAFIGLSENPLLHKIGTHLYLRTTHNTNIIYEDETAYCHLRVEQISKDPDKRLFFQDKLVHSEINMDDPTDLLYFYTLVYSEATRYFAQENNFKAMVIGGGGYVFPRYLMTNWLESSIEVIEIDPGVTKAAHEAFGLSKDVPIRSIHKDARNYIDELLWKIDKGSEFEKYDFIYEDAINDYSVPFQLVTREFNEKIKCILKPEGLYLINLIDIYDHGLFLGAVTHTLKQSFRNVFVVTNQSPLLSSRRTFIVVATDRPVNPETIFEKSKQRLDLWILDSEELNAFLSRVSPRLLTDDYCPVENLLSPVVLKDSKVQLAFVLMEQVDQYYNQKDYAKVVELCKKVISTCPEFSLKAYNKLALVYQETGNLPAAAIFLKQAIAFSEKNGDYRNIADTYLHLGAILKFLNQSKEANEYFEKATNAYRNKLATSPDSIRIRITLANALAELGRLSEASGVLIEAINIEPLNTDLYILLSSTFKLQHKYDQAIYYLNEGQNVLRAHKNNEAALKLKKALDAMIKHKNTYENSI